MAKLDLPPSMGGSGAPISSSAAPGQSTMLARLSRTKLPPPKASRSRLVLAIARASKARGSSKSFLP